MAACTQLNRDGILLQANGKGWGSFPFYHSPSVVLLTQLRLPEVLIGPVNEITYKFNLDLCIKSVQDERNYWTKFSTIYTNNISE